MSLRRVMAGLVPFSLAVQACSFGSSIVLARVLGASTATDAYFLGLSIPVLVYGILLVAIRQGAIPSLIEVGEDARALSRVSSELASAVLLASAALTGLVVAVTAVALPLLVGGDRQLVSSTRLALVELAPLGVLGALTGLLSALLAVRRVFAAPVAVLTLEPLLKIALMLVLGRRIGMQALIAGNLIGSGLAVCVLWILVRRKGIDLRLGRSANTRFVRSVILLSGPLLVSQSVLQVNPIVDRVMASDLGKGSVTSLELGLRLFLVPTGLLTGILIAPVTATWAERNRSAGWPAIQASMSRALRAIGLVVPPLVVLGVVLRSQLVALIFEGGAYSGAALRQTTSVFGVILLSLPAQVFVVFLATLFLVQRDAVFPMKVGIANVVLNVGLNFAFRPLFGAAGIALSTSLTLTVLFVAYVVAAYRRWGAFTAGSVWPLALRVCASAIAMASAAVLLISALPAASSRLQALLVVVVVGVAGLALHVTAMTVGRTTFAFGAVSQIRRLAIRGGR